MFNYISRNRVMVHDRSGRSYTLANIFRAFYKSLPPDKVLSLDDMENQFLESIRTHYEEVS
jgi:hypothetical protein